MEYILIVVVWLTGCILIGRDSRSGWKATLGAGLIAMSMYAMGAFMADAQVTMTAQVPLTFDNAQPEDIISGIRTSVTVLPTKQ
jgi:MFS-type transporter involved in bile tolerance (Atg22 family)